MTYLDDSTLDVNLSIDFDEDADIKPADIRKALVGCDLIEGYYNVLGRGSKDYDNKFANEYGKVLNKVRYFIREHKDKAFAYWVVFQEVYSKTVKQDSWSGKLYHEGKPTTFTKLKALMNNVLEMSTPTSSAKYYEGQFELWIEQRTFQPVQDYLRKVESKHKEDLPEWDNLAELLFGTTDPLYQEMISCWLVGAAKRAIVPGCFFKRTIILKGAQDGGKSAFVRALGGNWSCSIPHATNETDMLRFFKTNWLAEMAEIDKFTLSRDSSTLKQILSETVDKYVPKFKEADEMSETKRVTCIIGTTNADKFLKDATGNVRFQVIPMADDWKLPLQWLEKNRDKLWATAYRKYMDGHATAMSEAGLKESEVRNQEYLLEGSWNEQLEDVLEAATKPVSVRSDVPRVIAFKLVDLMKALTIKPENQGKNKAAILTSLKQLGYEQRAIKYNGKTVKLYCLKSATKPEFANHNGNNWEYGSITE